MKLNILSFILLHGILSSCVGQTPLWSNFSFKGEFLAIAPLSDSSFILAGGGSDWLLVKIDKTGSTIWQKNIGTNGNDCVRGIIPDRSGGFMVLGSWEENFDPPYRAGKSKLAKFDNNGELIWEKIYSKENYSYCALDRMIELKEKGYLLTGTCNSGKDVSKENMNYDAWIVRVDENGEILWEKTIAGPNSDGMDDIIQLKNGQLLLSGFSFMPDKEAEDEQNCQIMLIQLDTDGTIIGSKTIGGIGFEVADKIFPTPDGGFLLCGTTDSPDFGKPKSQSYEEDEDGEMYLDEDIFVCKVNKNLRLEWVKRYGGTDGDSLNDCVATNKGLAILGYSTSGDGDFAKSQLAVYLVFEVNWNGKIKWANTFDRAYISAVYKIGKINDEDFILTGQKEKTSGVFAFRKKGKTKK